jgi:hypothetical protein
VLDTHRVALNDLNQLRENIRNGKEKKKIKEKKKMCFHFVASTKTQLRKKSNKLDAVCS